jgi:hypothetical protein
MVNQKINQIIEASQTPTPRDQRSKIKTRREKREKHTNQVKGVFEAETKTDTRYKNDEMEQSPTDN